MTSSNGKFSASLALCDGIPLTGARQWRGALTFSLICASTYGQANNGDAGDLRCHRAHYDVTVVILMKLKLIPLACMKSLPSNVAKYIIIFVNSYSGDGLWLTVPRHCLNQWRFEIIGIHSNFVFQILVINQCLNKILHCCPGVC